MIERKVLLRGLAVTLLASTMALGSANGVANAAVMHASGAALGEPGVPSGVAGTVTGDGRQAPPAHMRAKAERRLRADGPMRKRPALKVAARERNSAELAEARRILAEYVARYPILEGSTVEFGDARGYQAICYYQSARIVISTTHTASLERIIGHEIWHIIDWRDNGRIDWGENVPPR